MQQQTRRKGQIRKREESKAKLAADLADLLTELVEHEEIRNLSRIVSEPPLALVWIDPDVARFWMEYQGVDHILAGEMMSR